HGLPHRAGTPGLDPRRRARDRELPSGRTHVRRVRSAGRAGLPDAFPAHALHRRLRHPRPPADVRGRGGGGAARLNATRRLWPWPQALRPSRASSTSKGTPGLSFAQRMTRLVLTLATFGAEVRSSVRKVWKLERSGATHFRMKSISPFSMWHSRTSGQSRHRCSKAERSASAWL